MSAFKSLSDRLAARRRRRRLGESDAPTDPAAPGTRATGGVPDTHAPDAHSTTGTTPSDTFVGRASGDDVGAAEQTGGEVRAQHARGRHRKA